jgi:hypothetical protein
VNRFEFDKQRFFSWVLVVRLAAKTPE